MCQLPVGKQLTGPSILHNIMVDSFPTGSIIICMEHIILYYYHDNWFNACTYNGIQ